MVIADYDVRHAGLWRRPPPARSSGGGRTPIGQEKGSKTCPVAANCPEVGDRLAAPRSQATSRRRASILPPRNRQYPCVIMLTRLRFRSMATGSRVRYNPESLPRAKAIKNRRPGFMRAAVQFLPGEWRAAFSF